jgi:fatty-acyl-CoA synthase
MSIARGAIPPLGFPEILRHNVRCFGDKVAITIDEDALTYRQLAELVATTRQRICAFVRPGDRVALWLPNSFAWIAGFLAAIELGAIVVPVNTRLTTSEVSVILRDAGTRLLITSDAYRGRAYGEEAVDSFDADSAGVVLVIPDGRLDGEWRSHVRSGLRDAALATELHDTFCIQYTSGTTALPKGVMLATRHYIATARHVGYCQTVSPSTNFMSAAPFFHCSGSMHAITVCLLAGCTLHTMSSWDPERMLDLVEQYRGDVSHGIYFRDIMALGAAKARPKLTTLRIGHDIGTPEQLRELHDDFGISGISNIYGMTETAGQFTMWHPDDPLQKRVNANGRTQPGNVIRIGDPQTGSALADT